VDIELVRRKFCMQTSVPTELVTAEGVTDVAVDELMVRMFVSEYHHVLGTVAYPDGWWEAFKERWLPFLGVRRKRFALEVAYPQFVPPPQLGEALPRVVPVFQDEVQALASLAAKGVRQ
jgi:hypothetical protein